MRLNHNESLILSVSKYFTPIEFRALFERYGRVVEADVMTDKNFGFVHVDAGMGNLADFKQKKPRP